MNGNINKTDIEVELLILAIKQCYAMDFTHYKMASLKRRLEYHVEKNKLTHISELIPYIIWSQKNFESLLFDISIPVTEMYRDPQVYAAINDKVIPFLKTFPKPRIWIAGCATGEEAYSLAILLHEANCLNQYQIIATDFNMKALKQAQLGIYNASAIKEYEINYQKAGGKFSLNQYFIKENDTIHVIPEIKNNITFIAHNLLYDAPIKDINLILCRNVFIYFDRLLQKQVTNLFFDSLSRGGFLCLGLKESLAFIEPHGFAPYDEKNRIYRKPFAAS